MLFALSSYGLSQKGKHFSWKVWTGSLFWGQRANTSWGEGWAASTVSAINLGYLAKNCYPLFVPDKNGNEMVDRDDLISVSEMFGSNSYMDSDPDLGTTDPELLFGLAKYVNETYPEEFEIKVYQDDFSQEYLQIMKEELPDEIFEVPVSIHPSPRFVNYSGELEAGEMV